MGTGTAGGPQEGSVFPGVQKTTWSWDEQAEMYYFHRFYAFQPDLDTHNPWVREEIKKVMGFWLQLDVAGFRMDAVPFFIEHKGPGVKPEQDFDLLHEMRDLLQWRARDAILLAEANVPPDESIRYFGAQGECLQMMLNFPVNQRLFYALATIAERMLPAGTPSPWRPTGTDGSVLGRPTVRSTGRSSCGPPTALALSRSLLPVSIEVLDIRTRTTIILGSRRVHVAARLDPFPCKPPLRGGRSIIRNHRFGTQCTGFP
jgi:hypothetical protein